MGPFLSRGWDVKGTPHLSPAGLDLKNAPSVFLPPAGMLLVSPPFPTRMLLVALIFLASCEKLDYEGWLNKPVPIHGSPEHPDGRCAVRGESSIPRLLIFDPLLP